MKIGQVAQAAALDRAFERRHRDINVTQKFLRDIERAAVRRARLNRLAERAGMEERAIPRVVLAGIRKLSVELKQLPRSGRALTRLRRSEAKAVLRVIEKLIRRQRRLETLLAGEMVWRRQIMKRLRATDAVLPLINAGHLDRLEELLARRRGKGGVNKGARALGLLRAAAHPYSPQHMSKLGRAGAARRWALARGEENNGNRERDAGVAGETGEAGQESFSAGNGAAG
jgi:hypothetical protein